MKVITALTDSAAWSTEVLNIFTATSQFSQVALHTSEDAPRTTGLSFTFSDFPDSRYDVGSLPVLLYNVACSDKHLWCQEWISLPRRISREPRDHRNHALTRSSISMKIRVSSSFKIETHFPSVKTDRRTSVDSFEFGSKSLSCSKRNVLRWSKTRETLGRFSCSWCQHHCTNAQMSSDKPMCIWSCGSLASYDLVYHRRVESDPPEWYFLGENLKKMG